LLDISSIAFINPRRQPVKISITHISCKLQKHKY
jgi:hypothetical protein